MVRKWSYLTHTQDQNISTSLLAMSKCYSFKVFRMTTRFKKYKRYETFFVRKQDSSRKRQTSWLTLLSIFSQWSLQYIKYKQLLRCYQNIGLYSYQLIIPNTLVIDKKINLFNPQLTFITSTLTKQWTSSVDYFSSSNFNTLSSNNYNENIFKEVNVSGLIFEKQIFNPRSKTLEILNSLSYDLYDNLFKISLAQVNLSYRVLTLLTLYNVK
jgi:hypothetical protein